MMCVCVSGAWCDKAWSYKAITTNTVMMCVCQELGVTKLGHVKRVQCNDVCVCVCQELGVTKLGHIKRVQCNDVLVCVRSLV